MYVVVIDDKTCDNDYTKSTHVRCEKKEGIVEGRSSYMHAPAHVRGRA